MASVTSLGLHEPTALQYLIREGLLPPEPNRSSYSWQIVPSDGADGDDDELLSTDKCVVWSKGGMVRKSYNFDVEDEPISQALLTTFLTDRRMLRGQSSEDATSTTKDTLKVRTRALVVFLKTQAHVYFLSGGSHVIHLPFEVELAVAAPSGLIVQRKLTTELGGAATLTLPKKPPNSFVSSQPQPFSAASSQISTFSIASLGSPKPLPLRTNPLLGDLFPTPTRNESTWPRLFSLTDPLSEMGLVVASGVDSLYVGRKASSKSLDLDPSEQIVYISPVNEYKSLQKSDEDPLILAVTVNQETSMYTVWRMAYMDTEDFGPTKPRSNKSRRRSSFAPVGTGTATPAASGHFGPRESFGTRAASQMGEEPSSSRKNLDIAQTLDPDFDREQNPRRESRRVSSMLARVDFSASYDRSAFTDLAGQHPPRRGESLGSQRASFGGRASLNGNGHQSQLNQSFLAPVDDLLDELRTSGDFEAFHNMDLHDNGFEGLKKEIMLTKIKSVPIEHSNVRFSTQNVPAQEQYKVFSLAAPPSASEDQIKAQIIVCIHDPGEKKLLVLTLQTQRYHRIQQSGGRRKKTSSTEELVVSWGEHTGARNILDVCKLTDGQTSRILVLTQSPDGIGELTIQAPWSVPMKIALPERLNVYNSRSLGNVSSLQTKRDHGLNRVLSQDPLSLLSLKSVRSQGVIDILGDDKNLHQLQISLEARDPHVNRILETCRITLPGSRRGEGVIVGWWYAMHWLRSENIKTVNPEWTALTVILFVMGMGCFGKSSFPKVSAPRSRKSRTGMLRSSSGAQASEEWADMMTQECVNGTSLPSWGKNRGWKWIDEQKEINFQHVSGPEPNVFDVNQASPFLVHHAGLARTFANSEYGEVALGTSGYLPTAQDKDPQSRQNAMATIITALHLLSEEQKLNTATADVSTSSSSLMPILAQLSYWAGWTDWVDIYKVDTPSAQCLELDTATKIEEEIPQPFPPPSIYDWVQACFIKKGLAEFMFLNDLISNPNAPKPSAERWQDLTPRSAMFKAFFLSLRTNTHSVEMIELLVAAGFDNIQLDTLPEAVLAPLREAIVECQKNPPTDWGKNLLELIQRDDVNMLLNPDKHRPLSYASLFSPSHIASLDITTISSSLHEPSTLGSFDGSAEVDRQAITRLIFKDDRRFNEASKILGTSKPTIARCEPQPTWNESDLLEAQKEHALTMANRTLAIPSGRGMLYFSARVPLLTERFPIAGFNLHCIMKPSNNTVAVEKNVFTEEKVSWAFFHSGVSAGLSVSRSAKGIDTSWVLYNKPQELSNRYAGFLLALGLNGHLKNLAKWVAFKFLTPKHTMTSIGLLLGLAASYLGTMDSLITRLLSVHVTRMLPPGAAELNLSPLTQTTGIMGIGLLYCNTQHRRMSEIMLSEIEHIDTDTDEEPLRTECYRLAAGFALGFINLGKGSDLKGLNDMRLTQRLLHLAVGVKKVDLVHVLDKATAAAVVAIALIFMKSGDQVLARKIDIPSSTLQFDYVRPDIFLLRTLAKHLILWDEVDATDVWIRQNLPEVYRTKSSLETIRNLSSEDLPFYNIMTGLCWSIALRHAGSGSVQVRDLLLRYLDHMIRICRLPVCNYDQKLTRSTVRNCQDLLSLSVATVMAGTGDLAVFRRLRSLHGREDSDTPYGSHMAAHLAVGALFLGGGTHTFGTSDIAVASLIVAFYPLFPMTILDNKCHLQAFRHFWVLATEARCLVARDIDTNRPVSIPLTLRMHTGEQYQRHAPCLLPEVSLLSSIKTTSPEYWNVTLDLEGNPAHIKTLSTTQSIFVRQRPAHDSTNSVFLSTLQALNDNETARQPLEWLFDLPAFAILTKAERALVLPPKNSNATGYISTESTVVDARLVLEKASLNSGQRDRLLGLRLLFEWADKAQAEGRRTQWIRREVINALKAAVWVRAEGDASR